MAKVEFRKTNVKLLQIELQRQMHAYQKWSIQHLNQCIWGEHYKIHTFFIWATYSCRLQFSQWKSNFFCLKFQNKKIAIGFSFMIVCSFLVIFIWFVYLFICCRCFVRSTFGAWNALFVTLTTTTMGKFVSKNIPARDTTFRFEYTMSKKWFTDLKSRYYHSSRIRSAPHQLRDEQKIQILKLKNLSINTENFEKKWSNLFHFLPPSRKKKVKMLTTTK